MSPDKSEYRIGQVSKNTMNPEIWVTSLGRYLLYPSIAISTAISHAMHAWAALSRVNTI